ncbi:Ladderlectin Precursor [Collichthys lucidus]|uniref:Ladderlectin n=1 Tax=Collichthys lucidus TaxID=240159 RepID=A0A4U5VKF3_COLLU|nr:Ladderlectin Precursor [Collichthys lucidus]
MKIVLLLCAAFALSTATEPVEEVAAAQETHPDVEPPVQMLDRMQEIGSILPRIACGSWAKYGNRCFLFVYTPKTWAEAEEGAWLWSDGDMFSRALWSNGQPDNYYNEHCVTMNEPGDLYWGDANCGNMYSFVCARKGKPV